MTAFLAARRTMLSNTGLRWQRKVVSYDAMRGQDGYYTFGSSPALASVTDRFQLARDATQTNGALRPTLDAAKMNGYDAFKAAASSNQRFNIQNARGVLRRVTKLQVRFPIRVDSLPAATQVLARFDSGSTNVSLLVFSLTPSGQLRASIRMTGVGAPANINLDSLGTVAAGVNSLAGFSLDTIPAVGRWRLDHRVNTVQALVSGVPGWNGGYTAFEDVDALVDPTLFRQSNTIDIWLGGFEMCTHAIDLDAEKAWWSIRQPELAGPLPKVTLADKSRLESCAVKRARPGATFEITGGSSSPGTNKITSVTVNGAAITSAAVDWATSHEATAAALAANINAYTATSGYRAHASGPRVIVESKIGGLLNDGKTLAVTVGGSVTVDDDSQALAMGAVHTLSGTVIAGQPNDDIKVRLLSWNDNTTETLALRTVATVTGSTSVERAWSGKLFVPRGAHVAAARLGADADYNETLNTVDGLFSGARILCNGQSNMKRLWAELLAAGVFPYAPTRSFQKHRRNSGEGRWDLSARVSGGGGVFVATGEDSNGPNDDGRTPLNDGAGGNGTVRFGIDALSLVSWPIELICVAIGSSGTPTRIPADLAPGAFEAGRNWQDFLDRMAGDFDIDGIVITDGEEEANGTTAYAAGKYTEYETAFIDLMRSSSYCGENVPVFLSVMGPSTTTGASTADPLRPGYTFAERIRNEQLAMIYGGVSNLHVANIPLDAPLADNQHGNYARYETFAQRLLRTFLHVYDPATFTTGCTGPIAISATCAAGTNAIKVQFSHDGGTGLTGVIANTNFTGWTTSLGGTPRNVTSSSVSGWELTLNVDGAASVLGQTASVENLKGNNPDGSNALCDNGTVKALAHPTIAPITCTVA